MAGKDSLFASSVYDSAKKELIIKFVNYNSKPVQVNFDINSKKKMKQAAVKTTLANADLSISTSFEEPLKIQPKMEQVSYKGKKIVDTFAPYSLTVIKLAVQ